LNNRSVVLSVLLLLGPLGLVVAETNIVSLRDFRTEELKSAGISLTGSTTIRLSALGGSEDEAWMSRSDGMFASAWIIDAATRKPVWEMTVSNSNTVASGDRKFEGSLTLGPGDYEVYFSAPTFSYRTWKSHVAINIDHRRHSLFGNEEDDPWFLKGWWSDDIPKAWEERAAQWGIDLYVDDARESRISSFTPPRKAGDVIFRASGVDDAEIIRQGLNVRKKTTLRVCCIGEITEGDDPVDFGWIINEENRKPVWEMNWKNTRPGGGASKNRIFEGDLRLDEGRYILYYVTDDSHSPEDWNSFPPYDPYNWGISVSAKPAEDAENVRLFDYDEIRNVVVAITGVGNDEQRQEGFALKRSASLRIYAFGEKSLSRRELADYGSIMDARTREKVWVMDVDRCHHAGGASKNVSTDEIVTLPAGSYLVTYTTDDSHAYDDWNATPPFDQKNYGITIMLAGENPDRSVLTAYEDQREKGLIAQIIGVRDGADSRKNFHLDQPARVRVYAIGEGQKRTMYDYGWIESIDKGTTVWEMTYGMTFHAGGARKNRMVSTTILLDKGDYVLRYISDDSHSFGDWNQEPPEDQRYWGISLYRDDSEAPPAPPVPPAPPRY